MEHLDLSEFVKDYNNAMKVEHLLIKYDITSHTFRILKKELKLERPRISRAQRIFKTNCVYTCNNINIPAKEVENKSIPQVIPPQPSQAMVTALMDHLPMAWHDQTPAHPLQPLLGHSIHGVSI